MYAWTTPARTQTTAPASKSTVPVDPRTNYFGLPYGGKYGDWAALQDAEVRRVQGEYEPLREELQLGFHNRGISRSGFALEEMANLEGRQAGAIGQVQAGNTDRLLQYKQQQDYLRYMKAQQKAQQGNSTNRWLGAALGVVGLAGAAFTGGATLPLAATGASMYMANS